MSNLPGTLDTPTNSAMTQLFNGVYYQSVLIDQGSYDLIYGFFLDKTGLAASADSLTQALISIGFSNKVNPTDILKEFDKATTESDIKKILIALFNGSKMPTSKVGYKKNVAQNKWVIRNIVA